MDEHYYQTCLDEIKRLEIFLGVCTSGLGYAANASQVVDVLKHRYIEEGRDIETEYNRAAVLEEFAKEQNDVGFSYAFNLGAIRLWGIVEAFVDDFIVSLIVKNDQARNRQPFIKLKGPLIEFAMLSEVEQGEYLLYMLKHELSSEFKLGIHKFESLLKAINLDGDVHSCISKNFLELSQIRNALVHRNGKVDSRLLKSCPWIKYNLRDDIHLSSTDLDKYIRTIHWYVLELSRRSTGWYSPGELSEGVATVERHEEVQNLIIEQLQTHSGSKQTVHIPTYRID